MRIDRAIVLTETGGVPAGDGAAFTTIIPIEGWAEWIDELEEPARGSHDGRDTPLSPSLNTETEDRIVSSARSSVELSIWHPDLRPA
jgi:hypothetical protein